MAGYLKETTDEQTLNNISTPTFIASIKERKWIPIQTMIVLRNTLGEYSLTDTLTTIRIFKEVMNVSMISMSATPDRSDIKSPLVATTFDKYPDIVENQGAILREDPDYALQDLSGADKVFYVKIWNHWRAQ